MRSYNPLAYARMVPSSSPIPQPPAPPWLIHRVKCYRFPGIHTRRLKGRGRALVGLSTSHDTPSGELVTHLIWDFLSTTDRLLMVKASPVIGAYARLRFFAASLGTDSWDELRTMGPIQDHTPSVHQPRAYRMAALLLLFDFDMGDLIRWLGGAYLHTHIPLDPIRKAVDDLRHLPQRPGHPVQDFDRALHILEHGAPMQAAYTCSRSDVHRRNLYNNHSGVAEHGDAVLQKITTDLNNSFVLVFPRWV